MRPSGNRSLETGIGSVVRKREMLRTHKSQIRHEIQTILLRVKKRGTERERKTELWDLLYAQSFADSGLSSAMISLSLHT